uniref:Uncharacterized protein n=1 Tax=Romanomermis culicivorax TaxID=13658 RepID=A0A915JK75_ROMCU
MLIFGALDVKLIGKVTTVLFCSKIVEFNNESSRSSIVLEYSVKFTVVRGATGFATHSVTFPISVEAKA